MLNWIKVQVDRVANIVKAFEELDPSAIVLPGIVRSVQLDGHSCGAQAMYVILRYYGKQFPISTLMRKLQTNADGTSTNAMRRVFRKEGLTTKIVADAGLRDLRHSIAAGHPILISTGAGEHWAVVYGYSPGHVFVCDPSLRSGFCCRIRVSRFRSMWDGWMMAAKP